MSLKTYSELITFSTFKERYLYLKLDGSVGEDTFGYDRYINQIFYKTKEWKAVRNKVIVRDMGCDLAIPDRVIFGRVLIHHMNVITKEDILYRSDILLNPEYLICVSKNTHDAIHYGSEDILVQDLVIRAKNDTCPWRK